MKTNYKLLKERYSLVKQDTIEQKIIEKRMKKEVKSLIENLEKISGKKIVLEGTWALPETEDHKKRAINDLEKWKIHYYGIVGDDEVFNGIDSAIARIKQLPLDSNSNDRTVDSSLNEDGVMQEAPRGNLSNQILKFLLEHETGHSYFFTDTKTGVSYLIGENTLAVDPQNLVEWFNQMKIAYGDNSGTTFDKAFKALVKLERKIK